MRFTLSSALLVASTFIASTSAKNWFAGFAASNEKSDGTCRTAADWGTMLDTAKAQGFTTVRLYGAECNAFALAGAAALARGMYVMAGVYANEGTIAASQTQLNNDVATFVSAINTIGHATFVGLIVGNEVADTATNIMNEVYNVRGYLNSLGYYGKVTTAHTWVFIQENPSMCGADFVAANAHAFYDGNTVAANAGPFVSYTVYPALTGACPGKTIVITESGWPSRGNDYGVAVPSLANEQTALYALNCAASGGAQIYAFEYDDLAWTANANEQSFGIFNKGLDFGTIFTC
ncbi:hypothetical protein FRB94_001831 [Tulasnella sp. JGI-2019a]|nr:hypothetical protein FRB93_004285 [Tulasnella sp. JGI-2019a]KAG9005139.1 hypothetical protein FRB94_001831 [Tulasnella sp. JGI-2019a]KAG9028086.1 hypothetical protein FRB95_006850 [Tulasnella sp. JGI-2019a]